MHWAQGALVGCLAGLLACGDDDTTIVLVSVPTEVAVNPNDFLGDTPCSALAGGMRSYVVTLQSFESREDNTAFVVGSSQPTPCSVIVGFRNSVDSGVYTADIDGYEQLASDLVPFGTVDSGSRQMHDAATGEVVEPRWTTHCGGTASTGALVETNQRVTIRPCDALEDAAPSATLITLGPEDVLGSEACTVAPDFSIEPETASLPPSPLVDCDAAPVAYEVAPGSHHVFYVTAHVGDALLGATCSATAVGGLTVSARCNPLSEGGTAEISLAGLLDGADQPVCAPGRYFDVFFGDQVLNGLPIACGTSAQVGPAPPGVQIFDVVIFDTAGTPIPAVQCGAEIEAGRTTAALCAVE
jgi:hypothetical protein